MSLASIHIPASIDEKIPLQTNLEQDLDHVTVRLDLPEEPQCPRLCPTRKTRMTPAG